MQMSQNLYEPPRSAPDTHPPPAAGRPMAISALQLASLALVILHGIGLGRAIKPVLFVLTEPYGELPQGLQEVIIFKLVLTLAAAIAFWAVARRKTYGRWLGVLSLALLVPALHGAFGALPEAVRASVPEFPLAVVLAAALLAWVWAAAFSLGARQYFSVGARPRVE